ncbi:MAG: PHP domain-containing protein [Candidatus Altiarchaeota archaeon]
MFYELHTHSNCSDGIPHPDEIVDYAKAIGLSGIAITDHNVIEGSLEALKLASADFTVIPGVEVSSVEGHILALNVRELVPRDMPAGETVERIHSLGGIAIAAHPYDLWRKGVGDLVLNLDFDAIEVYNGHTFGNSRNPVEAAGEVGLPMVGGSDAHTLGEIASVKVSVEGDVIESIKSGRVGIVKDALPTLLMKHAKGLVRRKILG